MMFLLVGSSTPCVSTHLFVVVVLVKVDAVVVADALLGGVAVVVIDDEEKVGVDTVTPGVVVSTCALVLTLPPSPHPKMLRVTLVGRVLSLVLRIVMIM